MAKTEAQLVAEAMEEYDDRIDEMLDDARGVQSTMANMEMDKKRAQAGTPGYVPATPDNPRPPPGPQRGNLGGDEDDDPYGIAAAAAAHRGRRGSRGRAPAGRTCELVVRLGASRSPLLLEIVRVLEEGGTDVVVQKLLQPRPRPKPILIRNLHPGQYRARLLRPVTGGRTSMSRGQGIIDLRPI